MLISKEMVPASSWTTKYLAVPDRDPVFLIRRRWFIDGRAVLVEQLYVNATRYPELLEKHYGIVERRVRITMRPTALNEVQEQALQIAVGTPGLYLTRTTLDQFDNIIEFDQEFWRHDVLEVEVDTDTRGDVMVSKSADKK